MLLRRAPPNAQQMPIGGLPVEETWREVPLGPGDLAYLTESNSSLKYALAIASKDIRATATGPAFSIDQGVLYCWDQERSQLVVPALLRDRVMQLAHDPPLAKKF